MVFQLIGGLTPVLSPRDRGAVAVWAVSASVVVFGATRTISLLDLDVTSMVFAIWASRTTPTLIVVHFAKCIVSHPLLGNPFLPRDTITKPTY